MSTSLGSKPPKKSIQIADSLRQLATEAGPQGKLPTYAELLSVLSVSRTTLNTALDELERQGVIYRRQGSGIFAASRKQSRTVALVCNPTFFQGRTHSAFWDVLLEQARDRAAAEALDSEVHFCKWDDQDTLPFSSTLLHSCEAGLAQGVLGVGMNHACGRWLEEKGIPYVSFGGPGSWYVGIDGPGIIRMGVQALAGQGCRRIGLLDAAEPFKSTALEETDAKMEVFRAALEDCGVPYHPHLMRLNQDLIGNPDFGVPLTPQEQGHRALHQLYADASVEPPDGLLFINDRVTAGALAAMKERQLQPGTDLHVTTHSNRGTSLLSPYEKVLTRLEIDPAQIVNTMFSTINELLNERELHGFVAQPASGQRTVLIPPVLHRPA